MKYILSIFSIALLLNACAPNQADVYPEDLKGRKELLKAKKTELKEIEKLMEKLQADIDKEEPPKEKKRAVVTTKPVEVKNFERYVDIQATVQSDDNVMASSETGGRIVSMNLKEGNYVKKGQLIATLDMEQVDKQIAELEKSLELAQEMYERQDRLWKQNIGSEMQYLQAKNSKERLEKSLETVRFQLTKANVYAPISGVVDMVMSKAGEMTGPGAPIVQIINTSKVKVVANLPETYLGTIKRGETVTIKFPALDIEKTGKVSLLGRSINPENRTFKVEVNMNNNNGVLKPNLLANMMINDFTAKDAVTLPLVLVQQEVSGKNYVFVQSENEEGLIAKKVYVTTGESYEGDIVITEGLDGTETIIIDGARSLTDNELIKVSNPVAEQTAPAK